MTAYAAKQAHLCELLAQSCATSWLPVLKGTVFASEWELRYSLVPDMGCVSQTHDDDKDDGDDVFDNDSTEEFCQDETETEELGTEEDNLYKTLLELDD